MVWCLRRSYRIRNLILLFLLMTWLPLSPAVAQGDRELTRRGEELVVKNCSRCHAVGRTGTSPHPKAPVFRTLGRRYNIENFAEGLVEGFSTGHPDMPEFIFEVDEAVAIIAYLKSIQER